MENEKDCEHAIAMLTDGLILYGKGYEKAFPDTKLGQDYMLGYGYQLIAIGLRVLLNGPTGSLDCGKLSSLIREAAKNAGVDLEALK